jgi:hypothetical protein
MMRVVEGEDVQRFRLVLAAKGRERTTTSGVSTRSFTGRIGGRKRTRAATNRAGVVSRAPRIATFSEPRDALGARRARDRKRAGDAARTCPRGS